MRTTLNSILTLWLALALAGCLKPTTAAICGDAVVTGSETCDDGDRNSDNTSITEHCNATCTGVVTPVIFGAECGNGHLDLGEACDDGAGNTTIKTNVAHCNDDCSAIVPAALPTCGDGITGAGELCDEGLRNSDTPTNVAHCNASCTAIVDAFVNAICGNGVKEGAEFCDDGTLNSETSTATAHCNSTCTARVPALPFCGNAIIDANEACDDGASNSDTASATSHCNATCSAVVPGQTSCGNGAIEANEFCDDGAANSNTPSSTSHCNALCTAFVAPLCGNGVIDAPEVCDDGAKNSNQHTSHEHCNATCTALVAPGFELLLDINTQRASVSPDHFTSVGALTLFTISEPAGTVLVATDGSTAPAVRLHTFRGASLQDAVTFNGFVYFPARDEVGDEGYELWRSDGTVMGTMMVADLCTGCDAFPGAFTEYQGWVYFAATYVLGVRGIFRTQGSATTTSLALARSADQLTGLASTLVFAAYEPATGTELWATDGVTTGLLLDFEPGVGGSIARISRLGDKAYAISGRSTLVTDGTPGGTLLIAESLNADSSAFPAPNFVALSTGEVLFRNWTEDAGRELWKTDGTPSGTALVKDINPGEALSDPWFMGLDSTRVFVRATTLDHGTELWVSDGTELGTYEVADLLAGPQSALPQAGAMFNGSLYFAARGDAGSGLYKSDSTRDGTVLVFDPVPDSDRDFDSMSGLTVSSNRLFFSTTDSMHERAAYVTDGTAAGPRLVAGLESTNSSGGAAARISVPTRLLATATKYFFFASDSSTGLEPWVTDGTTTGTFQLADIAPGELSGVVALNAKPILVNGVLYFVANDRVHGREIWRSDGTTDGTYLLKDLNPGPTGAIASNAIRFTSLGNDVFFPANDGTHGAQWWRTDGTSAGTALLVDGLTWLEGSGACAFGDGLIASGVSGSISGTYYVTPSETTLLTSGGFGDVKKQCEALGTRMVFASDHLVVSTDGTVAGSSTILDLSAEGAPDAYAVGLWALGDQLAIFVESPTVGGRLYKTDGTAMGTSLVGAVGTEVSDAVPFNGRLYFTARTALAGSELWSTDLASVAMVSDLAPGPVDGASSLMTFEDHLVFSGNDGLAGVEAWASDGTAAGTHPMPEIVQGPRGSFASPTSSLGHKLLLTANDGVTGPEYWVYDTTP